MIDFNSIMMFLVVALVILYFISAFIAPILLPIVKQIKEMAEKKKQEVIENDLDRRRIEGGVQKDLSKEGGETDEKRN